ncbi:MAG: MBL fold metallo-hydrolase [Syntrophobacteraceae bacterium CG23_combo_of_CG06-09_8_20_14_all_50_8]|nr:MAG: MBL fold metallo-hydrolase [Syntrophobacteraceae bacterium CG23_combo_of_CG06-09_8_20_14_all_50_8]
MIIRCWGARGSIPVSGKEYLMYGGDTTCLEIRTGNDEIVIIDAGSGIRRLGNLLLTENRYQYTMLFTHAHWDHLMGFPFFKPIYMEETSISVFGCPFAQTSIKHMISRIMAPPNFPVDFDNIKTAITYHESCDTLLALNLLSVTPIALSHPNQGMGYKLSEGGKCFVFLTDNELAYKHPGGLNYNAYVDFAYGADLLIHDAEYTEEDYQRTKTWGHSLYRHTLQLALDAKVKKLGLFHHNQERLDAAVDGIVEDCRKIIRERQSSLECFAVHQDMELVL